MSRPQLQTQPSELPHQGQVRANAGPEQTREHSGQTGQTGQTGGLPAKATPEKVAAGAPEPTPVPDNVIVPLAPYQESQFVDVPGNCVPANLEVRAINGGLRVTFLLHDYSWIALPVFEAAPFLVFAYLLTRKLPGTFPLVVGLFGAAILVGCVWEFLRERHLEIRPDRLDNVASVLGAELFRRSLPAAQIERVLIRSQVNGARLLSIESNADIWEVGAALEEKNLQWLEDLILAHIRPATPRDEPLRLAA